MDPMEIYNAKKEKFYRRTLLSSGLSLLLAAGSRLPTWEVKSPVGWLLGSVNVGFLPVFGPIIVFGLFCSTVLALRELLDLRQSLSTSLPQRHNPQASAVLLRAPQGLELQGGGPHRQIAQFVMAIWVFLIPVLSYGILVVSYFDFVRPDSPDSLEWRYEGRGAQIADLLFGTGGWAGFRPLAPAIEDNLRGMASDAQDDEERLRLERLAGSMPWIYPPFQTWAYIAGFVLLIYMSFLSWRDLRKNRMTESTEDEPDE